MTLDRAVARLSFAGREFEPGHVWLAGAGPGGLGCLTLEVVDALSRADAVVYDALVDVGALEAAPQAAHHYVGKRGGKASVPQDEIDRLLVSMAKEGKRVLRLKGGDPNVFGRGGEEAAALARAGVPFRFLPGVTSALGALADAGIPATMRGVNKAVVLATGHSTDEENPLDWAALARVGQPIVIYMGMRNLPDIAAALMAGGLAANTPAAVIMSATLPDERILIARLGTIAERVAEAGIGSPALIVVGAIVPLREKLAALVREHTS
jgi:uroporphyrin-III C-methyltransferase